MLHQLLDRQSVKKGFWYTVRNWYCHRYTNPRYLGLSMVTLMLNLRIINSLAVPIFSTKAWRRACLEKSPIWYYFGLIGRGYKVRLRLAASIAINLSHLGVALRRFILLVTWWITWRVTAKFMRNANKHTPNTKRKRKWRKKNKVQLNSCHSSMYIIRLEHEISIIQGHNKFTDLSWKW